MVDLIVQPVDVIVLRTDFSRLLLIFLDQGIDAPPEHVPRLFTHDRDVDEGLSRALLLS